MKINIYIKTIEKNEQYLCVSIIEAVKENKVLKTDIVKNIVLEVNDFINDIKNRFKKGITSKMNISVFSDTNFDEKLIEDTFFTKASSFINEIDFSEHFLELNEEKICPSFIYEIKDTNEENEIHLYLISSFFQENIHLIFEFPLFLHMKENCLIEEDCEVEVLVEEKYQELLYFNNKRIS